MQFLDGQTFGQYGRSRGEGAIVETDNPWIIGRGDELRRAELDRRREGPSDNVVQPEAGVPEDDPTKRTSDGRCQKVAEAGMIAYGQTVIRKQDCCPLIYSIPAFGRIAGAHRHVPIY